jgi:hypothetical protein
MGSAGARGTQRPARASRPAKKPSRFESSGVAYATAMAKAWLGAVRGAAGQARRVNSTVTNSSPDPAPE